MNVAICFFVGVLIGVAIGRVIMALFYRPRPAPDKTHSVLKEIERKLMNGEL